MLVVKFIRLAINCCLPYFANMTKDVSDNEEKYIFVERSLLLFDHVYAYIIDKLHPYPIEYYYEKINCMTLIINKQQI